MNQKTEHYLFLGQKKIPLIHKQTIIGRNPNATIFIEDNTVAKEHAIIQFNEDFREPLLIDKGSVKGCQVNGKLIPKNGQMRLYNGDFIKFGNYPLEYKFESTDDESDFSRDSVNLVDRKVKLAGDQPARFAEIDHF